MIILLIGGVVIGACVALVALAFHEWYRADCAERQMLEDHIARLHEHVARGVRLG